MKIITWNVLADCYSFGLEKDQSHMRLHHITWERWNLIKKYLLACDAEVICLQEVDHFIDCYHPFFEANGYCAHYLSRRNREDGCLIAYKKDILFLENKIEIHFDDLAERYMPSIKQKFQRQNCALLMKFSLVVDRNKVFWVSNCHLFWNPDYPEVKLAQICFLLQHIESVRSVYSHVIITGDFNSLPTSDVYNLVTTGLLPKSLFDKRDNVKFLCDSSLHRFCRWLRILGVDTALEADDEHAQRSAGNMQPLFDRCRREDRVLLTTSKLLTQRRRCPDNFVVSVTNFQEALVDLCLEFHVALNPDDFLTKCPKCNGSIESVHDDDPRLLDCPQKIPVGVPVFMCCGCSQAYWWSELENSSAVRAKKAADSLYEMVRHRMLVRRGRGRGCCSVEEATHTSSVDVDSSSESIAESVSSVEKLTLEDNVENGSLVRELGLESCTGQPDHGKPPGEEDKSAAPRVASTDKIFCASSETEIEADEDCSESEHSRLCLDDVQPEAPLVDDAATATATATAESAMASDNSDIDKLLANVVCLAEREQVSSRQSIVTNSRWCRFPAHRSVMAAVHGQEPTATNWNGGFRGTLDYIFASESVSIVDAQLLPSGFGTTDWCADTPPNEIWPSDHAMICCSISIH